MAMIPQAKLRKQVEDFKDKVTFEESPANISFFKKGNIIQITYQGASISHSANQKMFTLPDGYRPKNYSYIPFMKNANGYGIAEIRPNGECVINQISSTSIVGRICFTVTFIN